MAESMNVDEGVQTTPISPANGGVPFLGLPGDIYPYELPPDNVVEEPFDPITLCAICESGRIGPLDEAQLKSFLKEKLDRRSKRTSELIQNYTDDPLGFGAQLSRMRQRIKQITTCEKDYIGLLKDRIDRMVTVLYTQKRLPIFSSQLHLTNVAMKALENVGNEGPLTANDLKTLINEGGDSVQIHQNMRIQVKQQLKDVIYNINKIENMNRIHFDFTYNQIKKAINDIIRELLS